MSMAITAARSDASVLAGRSPAARGWVITDGKIGMEVQAKGVADALGLDYEHQAGRPEGD